MVGKKKIAILTGAGIRQKAELGGRGFLCFFAAMGKNCEPTGKRDVQGKSKKACKPREPAKQAKLDAEPKNKCRAGRRRQKLHAEPGLPGGGARGVGGGARVF